MQAASPGPGPGVESRKTLDQLGCISITRPLRPDELRLIAMARRLLNLDTDIVKGKSWVCAVSDQQQNLAKTEREEREV